MNTSAKCTPEYFARVENTKYLSCGYAKKMTVVTWHETITVDDEVLKIVRVSRRDGESHRDLTIAQARESLTLLHKMSDSEKARFLQLYSFELTR